MSTDRDDFALFCCGFVSALVCADQARTGEIASKERILAFIDMAIMTADRMLLQAPESRRHGWRKLYDAYKEGKLSEIAENFDIIAESVLH